MKLNNSVFYLILLLCSCNSSAELDKGEFHVINTGSRTDVILKDTVSVKGGSISYVLNPVLSDDNIYNVTFNINQKSQVTFNFIDRLGTTFVSRKIKAVEGRNDFEYIVPSNTNQISIDFTPSTNLKYKVKYIKSSFKNNESHSKRGNIVFGDIETQSCISAENIVKHKEQIGLLVKVWGANKYLSKKIFSKFDGLSIDNELISLFCDYILSGQDVESYLLKIIPDIDGGVLENLSSKNPSIDWVGNLKSNELKSRLTLYFDSFSVGGDYVTFVPQTKITNEVEIENENSIEFKIVILARTWVYLNYLNPYKKYSLNEFDNFFIEIIESGVFFEDDVDSLLNVMGAYFQDAHIQIVNEFNPTDQEKCSFPITVKFTKGRLFLTGFRDEDLLETNLEIGAEILQIGDDIIDEKYFDYFKYPSSNYKNRINKNVLRTFYNVSCGSKVRILTTYKDKKVEISLSAKVNKKLEYYGNSLPKKNEVILPNSIGYYDTSIYYKDNFNRIKDLLKKPYIVIDLRNYPSLESYELLPKILLGNYKRGYHLNILTKDSWLGEFSEAFYSDFQFTSEFEGYSGQMYILVGENTGSRAESLALTLSQYGKAIIIGSQTMGMNGTIVRAPLYKKHVLFFTGEEVTDLNNKALHHVGVPIDHKIEISIEQYLSGIDVHLMTVMNIYEEIKNHE